jgi:hypothetical protein
MVAASQLRVKKLIACAHGERRSRMIFSNGGAAGDDFED